MKEIELNQIFFGPPGTGKTYNTIDEAIKIVDPEFYKENYNKRDALKQRFKLLLLNNNKDSFGQIAFTTFHQSMSYEDFIEGIKPVINPTSDTILKYEIQEGIFKIVCNKAEESLSVDTNDSQSVFSFTEEEYIKAQFFKMSLGNTQLDDDNRNI